ncbi:FitA-like ribbon-helix-helix domain-containing protein [Thiothrix unzii]|jgi:plasmid stability protein|uniref:FitA-like ribbon-helix-helix domain-containing protein n=1 Tax=Thiothrix unzii TaxID=111769 RepID=UPI002A35B059|nr:DNA-binding protein [Thiothrix unzii]MDX9987193.1 DNA-binding protein [Thiothrix unzii]
MTNLIVRKLEPEIIEALKQRAARNGRSAEMEHRAILREVLLVLKKRSLAEVLAAMPNVGTDADFERIQGKQQVADVFA